MSLTCQLQAHGGGLSDLYDNTDSTALYMLPAPDSVIFFNLFTTIHDGNFRRHSSMNVTIK